MTMLESITSLESQARRPETGRKASPIEAAMRDAVSKSARTASITAKTPTAEELNDSGLSLLTTSIQAFNELREAYPQWIPNFSGENFENANLRGVNLSSAVLINTKFIAANLVESDLERANLSNAQLSSADLSHANLKYVIFSEADLTEAILNGADIRGARLETEDIDSGYFAEVTDEKGRTVKVLDLLDIKYDSSTVLPETTTFGTTSSRLFIGGKYIETETLLRSYRMAAKPSSPQQ